jgi:DedD protein
MALFKSRKKVDEPVAAPTPAESIEAMRRRARHRLIGAAVLVLAAVIGFPLLFDTQPRMVAVDIPIEIPDRNKVQPLPAPTAPVAAGRVTPAPAASAPAAAPVAAAPAAPVASAVAEAPPAEPATKPAEPPKPVARAEPAAPKPDPKAEEAAKARALLEGRSVEAAASGRFVVQVGAFADAAKAREARQKVERAGLKTYTNVAETKDGKRIRVRAGPFASRAEADKAAEKIKGLDLPAAILTL